MDTLQIKILNPKAKKLIKTLADLKLITIRKQPANQFLQIVNRLRAKNKHNIPSLKDITKEVEFVRSTRYARKK